METVLDQDAVQVLVDYVDLGVRREGCDHTFRFSRVWAQESGECWDDILDVLEAVGVYCDCEVLLNISGGPLVIDDADHGASPSNRWLLPVDFEYSVVETDRILVAKQGVGRNNHAVEGEWLVPAPMDAKPRKRVRRSVHYFVGVESGLPTEIAFVQVIEPIKIADYAQKIRESSVPELNRMSTRVAQLISKRIARASDGAPFGAFVRERIGVSSKHRELAVHRVVLGK